MQRHHTTEVLVVGAGPVGMLAALRLAERGIRVEIIDRESRTATHSAACALHPYSLELLDEAGIAEDAIKLGQPIDSIGFYDADTHARQATLRLSDLPVRFPFALVLDQAGLEDLLEDKLEQLAGIQVHWNHQLADLAPIAGGISAEVEKWGQTGKGYIVPEWDWVVEKTMTVEAAYLIGADGQNSMVRRRLGIDYERMGEPEHFVAYKFEPEAELEPEIKVVLDHESASAMWPFADGSCRWSFQKIPKRKPGDFPDKDREFVIIEEQPSEHDSRHRLLLLLEERAPWFDAGVLRVDWHSDIQFEHRLARQFGRDRCWLAGDAAHETGPVGMQSMNEGLWEAADLAARLGRMLREGGSPDLLQTYDADHRAEWRRLLGLAGGPQSAPDADPWISRHRDILTETIPATGDELTELLHRLELELK